MDTRSKSFSHSIFLKLIAFVVAVLCFTGVIKELADIARLNDGELGIVFEEDYFHSEAYLRQSERIISDITMLLGEYKNEEHILTGGTIDEAELKAAEKDLFWDFQINSRSHNPALSEAENFEIFKQEYAGKLKEAREKFIKEDLKFYHATLQRLEEYENPLYFGTDGENVFSNTSKKTRDEFSSNPSYMLFEGYKLEVYPKEVNDNEGFVRLKHTLDEFDPEGSAVYVAYTEEYLKPQMAEWKKNKADATKSFSFFGGYLAGFMLSLIYLLIVIGRRSNKADEKTVELNAVDRIYNDVKIVLGFGLFGLWVFLIDELFEIFDKVYIAITIPLAAVAFLLILSLVKHMKNRTFFKHSLIFKFFYMLYAFFRDVYANGSVAVKTVLLVIGYPVLVALTIFIFPITLGLAAWLALKRVKAFKAVQEGVERIKAGDLGHRIAVADGKGELARLAGNINSMTDGLKKAVDSELKSERLKTELITNVSHDIRTPLTSIITYVDLLKGEKDPAKVEEYVEVLDQKSKRLKVLTDDLFEAAKASSGDIPVQLEQIDIVSLVTQGLGEVNDKIEALDLEFKVGHPQEKLYVSADGKLLWRAVENLLSNIFKYALRGSRVYVDIEDLGEEVLLTFKNISAYELNISAEELMERFKRGDESRSSSGSGLGLSIAKSLVEIQKGRFSLQIDGDLFKAMISMPKEQR